MNVQMQSHDKERYDKFFDRVSVVDGRRMGGAAISYLAFQIEGDWCLASAKVYLDGVTAPVLQPYVGENVRAGHAG